MFRGLYTGEAIAWQPRSLKSGRDSRIVFTTACAIAGSTVTCGSSSVWHHDLLSDLDPRSAHEGKGTARGDNTWPHPVIKGQGAILKLILKMNVRRSRSQALGNLRQGKIVRGDEPDGAAIEKSSDNGFGSETAIVRIRAQK